MSTWTNASPAPCGWPSTGSEYRSTKEVLRHLYRGFPMKREFPLYSGASLQGTSWERVHRVEPLYKGQVGDGSFVHYTVEPLYKGQVGDGSFVHYTVEPLYKGRVLCSLYSGASLQGTSWGRVLCSLYSGASLQGTSCTGNGYFVPIGCREVILFPEVNNVLPL